MEIRKSIIRDQQERPIAVQIDYADWLKIEQLLSNGPTESRVADLNVYRGCIKLNEDPLAYQARVRAHWH